MTTYISILRGINVSGHNPIKMEALGQMYASLGYTGIVSYIQSGNVIFRSESMDIKSLEASIADMILHTFTWSVPVIVLSVSELKAALENNPFLKDSSKDPSYLHLTFLSDTADKLNIDKIAPESFLPDEFKFLDRTIYLYCPNGYGITKLSNSFFESKLKLIATTRNLRTAKELLVLAQKTDAM